MCCISFYNNNNSLKLKADMLQQNVDLHSTVIQMERRNILSHYCRIIVDTLICSEFEGKNGIKSTTEKAMGNVAQINVERSAVQRCCKFNKL